MSSPARPPRDAAGPTAGRKESLRERHDRMLREIDTAIADIDASLEIQGGPATGWPRPAGWRETA